MSSGAPVPPAGNWITALVGRERGEPAAHAPSLRPRLPYLFAPLAKAEAFDGDIEVRADQPAPLMVQPFAPVMAAPTVAAERDRGAGEPPRQGRASALARGVPPVAGSMRVPAAAPQALPVHQPAPRRDETSRDNQSDAGRDEEPNTPARPAVAETPVFRSETQPARRGGDPVSALRPVTRAAVPLPPLAPEAREPVIEISIGRIDIRAAPGREPPAVPRRETAGGHGEQLAAYLSRRSRGARS